MPLKLIRTNPGAGLLFSNFLCAIIVNSIAFNMPLYFQAVLLHSPTSSRLRLMVPSLSATFTCVSTGFLIPWSERLKPTLIAGGIGALISSLFGLDAGEHARLGICALSGTV